MEVLGELPRDGAELARLAHGLQRGKEALDSLAEVGETPDVREVAARLDREYEALGRLPHPSGHGVALGQAVEGGVNLDGVEVLRVELEPPALGLAGGIQP